MRQSDEQIKKNLEEQSQIKSKITSMTKRDQGNLTVRDYTDDIYNNNPSKDLFVETHGSDLFVNMLVVLNQEKVQAFMDNMEIGNVFLAYLRKILNRSQQRGYPIDDIPMMSSQWLVVSGYWSIFRGQWSVVIGYWPLLSG